MDISIIFIIFAVILLVAFSGHPVAFGLGGISVILGMAMWGPIPSFMPLFVSRLFTLMNSLPMIAIPLFLFMGATMDASRISTKLFSGMHVFVGNIPGGLGAGALIISILLAASTGIVTASLMLLGLMALPQMLKHGYDKKLAAGIVMAGGCLGVIIPPSLLLIIYGSVLSISVGKLFAGAFLPGLLLGTFYIGYVLLRVWLKPELAPVASIGNKETQSGDRLRAIKYVVPPLLLVGSVLGSILAGIATPTEAAGVGAFGAFILALFYREMNWQRLKLICHSTTLTTAMVMWLLFGGACFQAVFYGLGGGEAISSGFIGMEYNRWLVLGLILCVLFILGMFLDWIAILLIFMPAFLNAIIALGFDPLWFAILFCILMQTSFLTPPVGGALFFVKAVAPSEISFMDLVRSAPPFVIIQLLVLALAIVFPAIITWLPSLM
jgi:tripartite ATP-independent transporter DctM subunit